MCYLYWIHRKEDTSIGEQGYVGVADDYEARFAQHRADARTRPTYPIHHAINKYDDLTYEILCVGDREYIADLENKLRPEPRIGWNLAIGGRINYLDSESRQSQAENRSSLSRVECLFILIKYFINNKTSIELGMEYNVGHSAISDVINGIGIRFPELEYYRKSLRLLQRQDSKIRGSLSESQYDDILRKRENGWSYNRIAKDYMMHPTTIGYICKGIPKYLQKFKSYRKLN